MTSTPITDRLSQLLGSVERALKTAYLGSAEHGSFFRHGGGEYVPSVFMTFEDLQAEVAAVEPRSLKKGTKIKHDL